MWDRQDCEKCSGIEICMDCPSCDGRETTCEYCGYCHRCDTYQDV